MPKKIYFPNSYMYLMIILIHIGHIYWWYAVCSNAGYTCSLNNSIKRVSNAFYIYQMCTKMYILKYNGKNWYIWDCGKLDIYALFLLLLCYYYQNITLYDIKCHIHIALLSSYKMPVKSAEICPLLRNISKALIVIQLPMIRTYVYNYFHIHIFKY